LPVPVDSATVFGLFGCEDPVEQVDQSGASDRESASLIAERPWVLIAANPFSGKGPTRERVGELAAALLQQGLTPRVLWGRGERTRVLRDEQQHRGCRCVVAAGGDGTVADVINEMPTGLPLATLPVGNENLFAQQFGFPRDGEALARAIVGGRTRQVDVGRGGARLFSLMLTVGFDADVVHRVAQWRAGATGLKRVGRLSYAKPILSAIRSYPYDPLELVADGERVRGTHAMVFNLPQYGFHMPFAPDATADDGLLDWLVFERPGLAAMTRYLVAVLCRRHHSRSHVRHGRARQIRIEGPMPVPVQTDGDPGGFTPVDVEVMPQALTVLIT
jgi:YegS/Rv2252/BmrU family lipid kinase